MIVVILIFILILGLLIFSHELGHFILAKKAGIRVDEFGFGLPPRIFGIKRGGTIYSLNLLPLGGFVKIYGEDGEAKSDPASFSSKSVFSRSKIVVAGVIMNVILAMILFTIGHAIGLPAIIEDDVRGQFRDAKIQITRIAKGSPADLAGLKTGDTIKKLKITPKKFPQNLTGQENEKLKISEIEITGTKQLQETVAQHRGEEIVLVVGRGKEVLEKSLVPRENFPEGEGPMGIGMAKVGLVSYPWYLAPIKGIETTFMMAGAIISAFFLVLKNLIISGKMIVDIAGPVGIATLTFQAAKLGFIYVLQFTAFLSLNLAIINAIPFPALDGGRLLFLVLEKIRGRAVPASFEKKIHTAGFALLILLIAAVTFRDIGKLF